MGVQVGEPLCGHGSWIYSVAFSPNGALVVSGSHDETVQMWDVGNGMQVGGRLQGHCGGIYSVVFSPDGRCVVSGSLDGTLMIWDVEEHMHRKTSSTPMS